MKFLKPVLFLCILGSFLPCPAQIPEPRLQELFHKMDDPQITENHLVYEFLSSADKLGDTSLMRDLIYRLEKESTGRNGLFKMKAIHIRIWLMRRIDPQVSEKKTRPLIDQYLKLAYETADDRIIGIASWNYGAAMYYYQQLELASTYCLKGIETIEKEKDFDHLENCYWAMGEILFRTREYRQCIYYTLKSSQSLPDNSIESQKTNGKNMNTVGQAYYQLGKMDSALYYYKRSDEIFSKVPYELWQGINACFAGIAYFDLKEYDKAKPLLRYSYQTTVHNENVIAGYAGAWLARVLILEGKTDSANVFLNESLTLLKSANPNQAIQIDNYLQQVYFAKGELFHSRNNTDSFYFYNRQYTQLHDSLEHVAAMSNSKIAQLRINNEKDQFAMRDLVAEKSREKLIRNIIIIGITLLALVIIIILNRQKKMLRYKEETAQYQKKVLETEANAAKEQLGFFTKNLVEKNNMLEKLQEQLSKTAFNQSQQQTQQVINELSSQVILTEDDWTRFKNLFEKNYPAFFMKLKNAAPDITLAEQRMAALTRLNLSSKQMASMLGISVDSVYKTKQRLRQRVNIIAEADLEDFIAGI